MGKKKRQYEARIRAKENNHVSQKSDNRVICPKTGRKKFLYSTLQKALTACKFSKDPQRPYYCKRCFGYHTTSETKPQQRFRLPLQNQRFYNPFPPYTAE